LRSSGKQSPSGEVEFEKRLGLKNRWHRKGKNIGVVLGKKARVQSGKESRAKLNLGWEGTVGGVPISSEKGGGGGGRCVI